MRRPRFLAPLVLIVSTLTSAPILVTAATQLDGSLSRLATAEAWTKVLRNIVPTPSVALALLAYVALEALLLVGLPGPIYVAPREGAPRYRLNGVAALLSTHLVVGA